jgi:hypothetical protein
MRAPDCLIFRHACKQHIRLRRKNTVGREIIWDPLKQHLNVLVLDRSVVLVVPLAVRRKPVAQQHPLLWCVVDSR